MRFSAYPKDNCVFVTSDFLWKILAYKPTTILIHKRCKTFKKMRIGYKKRNLNINLILGIVWLIFGLLDLNFSKENRWTDYGDLLFGILYLILYFYQKRSKYLTIENGILKVNGSFGKKINLTEIKRIKKFAGDYILKTDKKELTINTQIIDPKSLAELNTELEKLNVEWK